MRLVIEDFEILEFVVEQRRWFTLDVQLRERVGRAFQLLLDLRQDPAEAATLAETVSPGMNSLVIFPTNRPPSAR